ncbi:hypothetical protein H3Z83_09890 [Tenacibaculum sp. S7007]|uniref:Uncharacterized protein n=1 Tax=Tenacibaculum pelagium TaxID=2759527 RepID=A0A839AP00_9FLAO|nr:hypothetical protein [Tenacibaculum pelagium]MBA6156825.1 hypothetical protein [Tenacibaculum pelagium]
MKKTTKTILTMILFLCLGGLFGYTVTSSIKGTDRSKKITEVLKDNCNCKEVNQIIYAKGVQFGSNGLSTEKGEYQLVDCKFSSAKKEAQKIQDLLLSKIKGFNKVDLLELEFINGDDSETIIIKNGKIQ